MKKTNTTIGNIVFYDRYEELYQSRSLCSNIAQKSDPTSEMNGNSDYFSKTLDALWKIPPN